MSAVILAVSLNNVVVGPHISTSRKLLILAVASFETGISAITENITRNEYCA